MEALSLLLLLLLLVLLLLLLLLLLRLLLLWWPDVCLDVRILLRWLGVNFLLLLFLLQGMLGILAGLLLRTAYGMCSSRNTAQTRREGCL